MDINGNLGLIERRLRKVRGFSLDNISDSLGVSKSFISDAEKGRRILKPDIFSEFIKEYGIDFNDDLLLVEQIHLSLNSLIQAWIDRDFLDEQNIINSIERRRPLFENSYACLHLLLIDLFLTLRIPPRKLSIQHENCLLEIENYISFFSPDEQALIFFLKGYDSDKRKRFNTASEYYDNAIRVLNKKQWPELEGIVKYHLASVLMASSSYFQAYNLVQEARTIFVKHRNYLRIMLCDNNSSSYLIAMQEFKAAKTCIFEVIRAQKRWFHNDPEPSNSTTLMILALTLEGEFEQAIQYIKDNPFPIENGYIGNLSLIPCCLYRLGNSKACLNMINDLSKENPTADDQALFDILKGIINNNHSKIEEAKYRMQRICCKEYNWWMLMVLYQLMIAYYEAEGKSELLNDAYRQQARILHHQLPDNTADGQ